MKRYSISYQDLWLLDVHNGVKELGIPPVDIDKYSAVKKHLDQFYPLLKKRLDKGVTPYNLRNCAYMEDFSKQKIVYPDIVRMPRKRTKYNEYPHMFLDENGYYIEATNFMMVGENLKFILGILTSRLGVYAYIKYYTGPIFDDKGIRYKKAYLEQFPIPRVESIPNQNIVGEIIDLVDEIQNIRKMDEDIQRIITLDKLLDEKIYELYGISTIEREEIEKCLNY